MYPCEFSRSRWHFLSKALSSAGESSALILALFLIDLALQSTDDELKPNPSRTSCPTYLIPNRNVDSVSASL